MEKPVEECSKSGIQDSHLGYLHRNVALESQKLLVSFSDWEDAKSSTRKQGRKRQRSTRGRQGPPSWNLWANSAYEKPRETLWDCGLGCKISTPLFLSLCHRTQWNLDSELSFSHGWHSHFAWLCPDAPCCVMEIAVAEREWSNKFREGLCHFSVPFLPVCLPFLLLLCTPLASHLSKRTCAPNVDLHELNLSRGKKDLPKKGDQTQPSQSSCDLQGNLHLLPTTPFILCPTFSSSEPKSFLQTKQLQLCLPKTWIWVKLFNNNNNTL